MVDFQSRDTRRGLSDDDEDEDEEAAESEAGDETAEVEGDDDPGEVEAGNGTAEIEGGDQAAEAGAGDEMADAETGDEMAATEPGATAEDPLEDHGHDHEHEESHDHEHGHGEGSTEEGHDHAGHHHADVEQLGVAVVTVSSSRDLDHDPSGDAAQSLFEGEGHSVVARDLVADDLDGIQRAVLSLTGREDVDVVVTSGGTGVTPDDVTVEAVEPLFDKELPGFGELFRILSYEEVGTRALGSRASAGVSEGVPVFCLPGSEDAVRTAVEELILAEAPHLVGLARDA